MALPIPYLQIKCTPKWLSTSIMLTSCQFVTGICTLLVWISSRIIILCLIRKTDRSVLRSQFINKMMRIKPYLWHLQMKRLIRNLSLLSNLVLCLWWFSSFLLSFSTPWPTFCFVNSKETNLTILQSWKMTKQRNCYRQILRMLDRKSVV